MHLSPADDVFVRIERRLDIDTEGQLIASVLSRRSLPVRPASSSVIFPWVPPPKENYCNIEAAQHLADRLTETAAQFRLVLRCIFSDGNQPVGRGIGPALEAQDIAGGALRCDEDAPMDLRERAASVAGVVLELAGRWPRGDGMRLALETIDSGCAWEVPAHLRGTGGCVNPRCRYVEP